MPYTNCQYRFAVVMTGDPCVGKSWMLYRYKNGCCPERNWVTIGEDFSNHIIQVEPGVKVFLRIWDTTGVELGWDSVSRHIPFVAGCLLVFDLNNHNSFENIKHRYLKVCKEVDQNTMFFLIVGQKSDIKERQVTQEEAESFASELRVPYIETSAITGQNVTKAFQLLTHRIYDGYIRGDVNFPENCGKIHKKKDDNNMDDNNKCCVL